jgi:hypothetical protein
MGPKDLISMRFIIIKKEKTKKKKEEDTNARHLPWVSSLQIQFIINI